MEAKPVPIHVRVLDESEVIRYAADELGRCLKKITGLDCIQSNEPQEECIRLGLMSSFPDIQAPQVEDSTLDDAIYIHVEGNKGIIAGINPRSVLLAVYRYLTALGCRWVRPGELGEYMPKLGILPDVSLSEVPSYRHRGVCIEGAVSYENIRDMVDFIPKLGFNSYFIQFRESYGFFYRWYAHRGNPLLEAEDVPIERAEAYTSRLADEIKRRGLLYHAVGHGWTCEPLGIRGLCGGEAGEAGPYGCEVPSGVSKYFAEIDGERKLNKGVAINTNLCYSNPEVRSMMVEEVVSYAKSHPQIDLMHFWLADAINVMCECEECRKSTPSDYYVQMLNSIDTRLAEEGMDTRVVFVICYDVLWPPVDVEINNPDRFLLMFAPIDRTYSSAFTCGNKLPPLPPYELNKLQSPKSVEENVASLKVWQDYFSGDGFDFDYHLMWDHYNDPGYMRINEILSQDIKGLKNIGLKGYMSCQTNRSFLPTGLPMTVMGRTLWNTELALQEITDDYFQHAFGPDWESCRDYLTELSDLFDPVYLRGEKTVIDPTAAESFGKILDVVRRFEPVIQRNLDSDEPVRAESYRLLKFHGELCIFLAEVLRHRASGDVDAAREAWQDLKHMLRKNELLVQPVFDVLLFFFTFGEMKLHYDTGLLI